MKANRVLELIVSREGREPASRAATDAVTSLAAGSRDDAERGRVP